MATPDEERARERTLPPTQMVQLDPDGPVWAVTVSEQGALVGAIWCAERPGAIPRAGIVNVPRPSLRFQEVYGVETLRHRRDETLDAHVWISGLSDGLYVMGTPQRFASVDDVRRLTGLID